MVSKRGNLIEGLDLPKYRKYKSSARPWKRIFAFIIDLFIIDLVLFSFFRPIFSSIGVSPASLLSSNDALVKVMVTTSILMSVLMLAYFTIFEFVMRQTPGKMFFNLKVSSDINIYQAFIRNLWAIPMFPFFLLWIIDPIFMIFRKDRRRLSEILSSTKTEESFMG